MELEVYNEYAIVQHYSDLTDYITENIYILDKKNQSEIITENWGLIAIGAVVAVALVWGIILLVKHLQKGKEKDKKMKKTEKEVEQVEQAATQAVQRTNTSDDDISKIGSFLIYALLKRHVGTYKETEEGSSNKVTKGAYKSGINQLLTKIDLRQLSGSTSSNRRAIYQDIKDTKEKFEKSSNSMIKNLAKSIDLEKVNNYLKDDNNSLAYAISDKSATILGRFLNENINFENTIKAAEKEEDTRYENEGISTAQTIAEVPIPNGYDKYIKKHLKNIINQVNVVSGKNAKGVLNSADSTNGNISDEFVDLLDVLKNYKDFPTQILSNFTAANDKFKSIIEPLHNFNEKRPNFTDALKKVVNAICFLIENFDNFDIEEGSQEFTDLTDNNDADKVKETIRYFIFAQTIRIISFYFENLISNKTSYDFTSYKVKISKKDYMIKDLLSSPASTKYSVNSPGQLKKEIDTKFKNVPDGDIKKKINESIQYIGKRLIYFDTASDRADKYYSAICIAYAAVLGVTTAKANPKDVQAYINKNKAKTQTI